MDNKNGRAFLHIKDSNECLGTDPQEVIILITRKEFTEPEIVKFEESLDKVTLNLNSYSTSSGSAGKSS